MSFIGSKFASYGSVDGTRFEVIGKIHNVETIAVRFSIKEQEQLIRLYGKGRWRKLKGQAVVRTADGMMKRAEIHWYEAHGFGRRKIKIKKWIDQ